MTKFLAGVFSDGGQPSFSRVATGVALIASIAWVSYLVIHNKTLPDFYGIAMFISVPYALNRLTNMAEVFAPKK